MKSFLNACGIKDSLRLVVEGPEAKGGDSRWFPQPFVVIGRDPRADMLLDDPQISRRHVYLQAVGGWLFWVDLESRTGTRTEAGPQKSGWLTGNGFLGIGPYAIRRRAAATEPAGESVTGRTTSGSTPGRAGLQPRAVTRGRPGVSQRSVEIDALADAPGHVDDRVGQELQVPADRSECLGDPCELAADAGGAVGRRSARGPQHQRQWCADAIQ